MYLRSLYLYAEPEVSILARHYHSHLIGNTSVEIVWVDDRIHRAGLLLLQARIDKTYSLCYAVSFLLMREHGITEALTTDRHFEQEGFIRLLTP